MLKKYDAFRLLKAMAEHVATIVQFSHCFFEERPFEMEVVPPADWENGCPHFYIGKPATQVSELAPNAVSINGVVTSRTMCVARNIQSEANANLQTRQAGENEHGR